MNLLRTALLCAAMIGLAGVVSVRAEDQPILPTATQSSRRFIARGKIACRRPRTTSRSARGKIARRYHRPTKRLLLRANRSSKQHRPYPLSETGAAYQFGTIGDASSHR